MFVEKTFDVCYYFAVKKGNTMKKMEKHIVNRTVRAYQVDRHGLLRPVILMNLLQDMADIHAEKIGVGYTFCREKNLAWVVTHYAIEIERMPRVNQVLTLATWPSGQDALRATRDFEVFDDHGNVCFRATSQWILIDLESRRPLILARNIPEFPVLEERSLDIKFESFPEFETQKTQEFEPRFDDIDVNQHVNNAIYTVWATESLGFDFRNAHSLKSISIQFKKEIPDSVRKISVESRLNNKTSMHRLMSLDGLFHAGIKCEWTDA